MLLSAASTLSSDWWPAVVYGAAPDKALEREPRPSRGSGPRVRTDRPAEPPGDPWGGARAGALRCPGVPFAAHPETPPPSGPPEWVPGPFPGQPGGPDQQHGPSSGGDPDLHLVPWGPDLLTPTPGWRGGLLGALVSPPRTAPPRGRLGLRGAGTAGPPGSARQQL